MFFSITYYSLLLNIYSIDLHTFAKNDKFGV